jgi:hypothetical protein
MKVNPHRNISIAGTTAATRKPAVVSKAATNSNLRASVELTQKLAATPGVRAGEVARAKLLVAKPDYPDDKTIRAVARQMAGTIRDS